MCWVFPRRKSVAHVESELNMRYAPSSNVHLKLAFACKRVGQVRFEKQWRKWFGES